MKKISELSTNELKKVFYKNVKLQEEIAEDYEEGEMLFVSEVLDLFKGSLCDWSIGFYNNNFIQIKNQLDFLESFILAQKNYCILKNDDIEIKKMENLINKISEIDYIELSSTNYNRFEKWIDNNIKYYENSLVHFFNEITKYSGQDLEFYFVDFYSEERMSDDYYIDDSFILYENISYIKSYN